MKMRLLVTLLALGGATALALTQAFSDEKEGVPPSMDAEKMKAMQEYMKLASPGENHKHLEPIIGKWDTVWKMWMGGPGSEPSESNGTMENTWVLGGRYVLSEAKSELEFPNPADPSKTMKIPFEGMGLLGYDNFRNMYTGTWCDSMGTQLLTYKGTRNPKTGVFVYYGEMDEPYLPGIGPVVGRYVRYVTRIINKDKHIFEMYDVHAGEDYKVFEIVYTRRK